MAEENAVLMKAVQRALKGRPIFVRGMVEENDALIASPGLTLGADHKTCFKRLFPLDPKKHIHLCPHERDPRIAMQSMNTLKVSSMTSPFTQIIVDCTMRRRIDYRKLIGGYSSMH